MKKLLLLSLLSSLCFASDFYYEFGKKVEMKPKLQAQSLNTQSNDILEYETTEGKKVKFKNEIIIQCKKDSNCEKVFKDENINNYSKISNAFYLIKLNSSQNIFEYCQKLYTNDSILIAHPNFIKERVYR